MVLTRPAGLAVVMALLAAPAFAQQNSTQGNGAAPHTAPTTPPAATHPPANTPNQQRLVTAPNRAQKGPTGSLQKSHDDWRASKLVGATVYNDSGDNIGSIDDLLIGTDGTIKTAVISVGGFIGIGNKLVSVPYDQLKFEESTGNTRTASASGTASSNGGASSSNNSPANPAHPAGTSNSGAAAVPAAPQYFSIVLPGATSDSLKKDPAFNY